MLPIKFDLSLRLILILVCPRGDLRQKNSMKFKGVFQKCGRGDRPGRAAQRFVFHAYNFAIIFTEDFTGVIFLSFSRADINFSRVVAEIFSLVVFCFQGRKTRIFHRKPYFFDGKKH